MCLSKYLRSAASLLPLALTAPAFFVAFLFAAALPANAAGVLAAPKGQVILTLSGQISNTNVSDSARFDRDMLEALGMKKIRTSTPWTEGVSVFEGVLVRDLLAAVGASGKVVRATAINDYGVSIPISDFTEHEVILALKINGKYMRVRDKGPLWIIYPLDDHPQLKEPVIFERSIWQLNKITVK